MSIIILVNSNRQCCNLLLKFDYLGDSLKGVKGGKAVNGGKHSVPKDSAKRELSINTGLYCLFGSLLSLASLYLVLNRYLFSNGDM